MSSKLIVKNTVYLSSAYVGQKVLSFVYFTLIARFVGVVDTGAYVFALSFSTIFSVFVDFGLAPYILREIAQKPEKTESIVGHTLGIKLIYAILSAVVGLVIINFMTDDVQTIQMVSLAMLLMIIDSFHLTIWHVFRGIQKLQYEAIAVLIGQILVLVVGILGLVNGESLVVLIIALLVGSGFNAFFAGLMMKFKLGFWPKITLARDIQLNFIRQSLPFGLAGAFTRVFASIDSVMLRVLASEAAVGYYSVPNKIVFAAQFVPNAVAASIYPAMSEYYKKDKSKMIDVFKNSMLFLMLISIPLAVGTFVVTPELIPQVFTNEFSKSIPAMYILVWGIIFGFIEFPIGAMLNAIGEQKKNMYTRLIVMIINVILNLVLIPKYSFVGAAIAAVVSYASLVVIGLYWLNKKVKIPGAFLSDKFFRIIISSVVMGIIVYWFLPYMHFVIASILGASIYGLCLFVFRVVTWPDLMKMRL